jgi:sigma-E factor negative regulatory protein RseA
MDGEAGEFSAHGSRGLELGDPQAREAWHTYHLIGDLLRGLPPTAPDFSARVSRALAGEPTVLAPRKILSGGASSARWAVLSAAAGIAGVAWVSWMTFAPTAPGRLQVTAKLEAARRAPVAASHGAESARVPPPRAAEYLLAHQPYSPRLTLQGMAPYVRTVSDSAATNSKGGK